MSKRIERWFACENAYSRTRARPGGGIGPGDPWRVGEPLTGLPFECRLRAMINSCIIGKDEESTEGGVMTWHSAEKSKNMFQQQWIFPRGAWKTPPVVRNSSGYVSTGGRITGDSGPIIQYSEFCPNNFKLAVI